MAIIRMMHNTQYNCETHKSEEVTVFPDGAYCPIVEWNNDLTGVHYEKRDYYKDHSFEEWQHAKALILYTTHHGLCLSDYERNGYHDSDWYMIVWNPEKGCTEEIEFASTRGWTYPCYGSSADATPEVIAAWEAWKAANIRRKRIQAKWWARRQIRENAAKAAITTGQYRKLLNNFSGETLTRVFKLLTSNLRSEFRKSMAKQLRDWLDDPAPKYSRPFSEKQLYYV